MLALAGDKPPDVAPPTQGTRGRPTKVQVASILLVVLAVLVAYGGVAVSRTWVFQALAVAQSTNVTEVFESSAMALDAGGRVHLVYTSTLEGLLFRLQAVGGWSRSVIDATATWAPSIAIDSHGADHVALTVIGGASTSHPGPNLHYATDAGGSWVVTDLDAGASPGSIAVDGNDGVHVAYGKYADCSLRYATLKGGSWTSTTAANWTPCTPDWSIWVRLALDEQGGPHIAYGTFTSVGYAALEDGRWISETLSPGIAYGGPSIAIDASGQVHIAAILGGVLLHFHRQGGPWLNESIERPGPQIPGYAEIGVDPSGVVYVVYNDLSDALIRYAAYRGGSWSVSTIESGINAYGVSALIGPGDRIQVAYIRYSGDLPPSNTTRGTLAYATNAVDATNLAEFLVTGLAWAGLLATWTGVVILVALRLTRFRAPSGFGR